MIGEIFRTQDFDFRLPEEGGLRRLHSASGMRVWRRRG
jgi:hypothetical protein